MASGHGYNPVTIDMNSVKSVSIPERFPAWEAYSRMDMILVWRKRNGLRIMISTGGLLKSGSGSKDRPSVSWEEDGKRGLVCTSIDITIFIPYIMRPLPYRKTGDGYSIHHHTGK